MPPDRKKYVWDEEEETAAPEEVGRAAEWRKRQQALATAGANTTPPTSASSSGTQRAEVPANAPQHLVDQLRDAEKAMEAANQSLAAAIKEDNWNKQSTAQKALDTATTRRDKARADIYAATKTKEPTPAAPARGGSGVTQPWLITRDGQGKIIGAERNPNWNQTGPASQPVLRVTHPLTGEVEEVDNLAYKPSGGAGRDNTVGLANLSLNEKKFAYQQEKDNQTRLDAESKAQAAAAQAQAQMNALNARNAEDNARMLEERRVQEAEANRRAQMQSQVSLANNAQSAWQAAFPYMQIPGQTNYLGFEEGGPWSVAAGMNRMPFDADRFKIAQTQFDPQSFVDWARRQQLSGGQ